MPTLMLGRSLGVRRGASRPDQAQATADRWKLLQLPRPREAAAPPDADQFELTLNEPSAFAALVEGALTGLK